MKPKCFDLLDSLSMRMHIAEMRSLPAGIDIPFLLLEIFSSEGLQSFISYRYNCLNTSTIATSTIIIIIIIITHISHFCTLASIL